LTFGVLALLCGICSGLALSGLLKPPTAASDKPANAQLDWSTKLQHLDDNSESAKLVGYAGLALTPVFAILMITSGIGLLTLKSWSRTLALVWACLEILWGLFSLGYMWLVSFPKFNDFLANNPPPDQGTAMFAKAAMIGGGLGPIVPLIYALIVLLVLCRSSVKLAFARGAAPAAPDEMPRDDRLGPDDGWSDSANP
jgi:hypothetical protein